VKSKRRCESKLPECKNKKTSKLASSKLTWPEFKIKKMPRVGELKIEMARLPIQKDAEISELKTEIVGLKGQINVLLQRLALAAEQQKASNEYAKKVERELAGYKTQTAKGADPKELQFAVRGLESSVINLITANNLVTSTLLPSSNRNPLDFTAAQKSE
jgi:hypothetical protein